LRWRIKTDTSTFSADLTRVESAFSFGVSERSELAEPHWYAAKTRANHEKRVAQQLSLRSIPCFLPVYESLRTWKDRRKRLALPLFPGYIFVRIRVQERLRVLEIASVACLVTFGSLPCALPDSQIEALQNIPSFRLAAESYDYSAPGQRVRIIRGPLQGIEGMLVRRKGSLRLVLSIDLIQQAASVEVDINDVELLGAVYES
jgi:transcription antitermination factor NusG